MNITTNSFLCVGCKKPRKKRSKFCSVECYWTTLKRKYETKCQICGKKYWTFPSHQKKFCTRKCAYQFISENYRGSKSRAGWKGGKISRACIQCKKNFYRFPAQINKKPCKFCSRLCYDKWVKEGKRKKEDHPRWIDGRSYLPYPPEFNRKLKKEIKERDRYPERLNGFPHSMGIYQKKWGSCRKAWVHCGIEKVTRGKWRLVL